MAKQRKRSPAYEKRVEAFRRNHGGLSPYEWQKRRLATFGLTPWEARKARAERRLGPVRQATAQRLERLETVRGLSVAAMHRANMEWSANPPEYVARIGSGQAGTEGDWNPALTHGESRRGLAVLVNQYHAGLGEQNPAYVLAFYNAIVNPVSNYMSDHTIDAEGTISPEFIGGKRAKRSNRVVGNKAFREYLISWSEAIAEVDMDTMEAWFDQRYSMALA